MSDDTRRSGAAGARDNRAPLRVLHIYRRFYPDYTGDGIYYTRLIRYLTEHGIEGEVLTYETRTDAGTETAVHEGIQVHYLANRSGTSNELDLLRWMQRNLHRFDLVHLHSHVDRRFVSYAAARFRGRPILFSCSLDDSPTELLQTYQHRNRGLAALLMRTISSFVVISPQLLRRSLETTSSSRLDFIPQGVILRKRATAEDRAKAREELGIRPDDLLLLNVGSVSRRKNVAFLTEMMARIEDPTVRLAIVGPLLEKEYAAEIQERLERDGVADRVIMAGFQADPTLWYMAADAFVFASTSEGFPNVYLEAMSWSLPIITLFLPGLTDFIVEHGRTGFLARDTEDFVEAILRLRANPQLRTAMGEANRRFAERNLEMGQVASAYAKLYREKCGHEPSVEQHSPPFPNLNIRFTAAMAAGPSSIGLREFKTPEEWPPLLQVVIDTEADFDWDKGVATDQGDVSSILELAAKFDVFRKHGIKPCLVIDHPIATQKQSGRIVRGLAEEGCEIGVHLHPWTAPPLVEIKDSWHSFSGNLGPTLEFTKLANLRLRVEDLLGRPSRIFKAGRYGLSPNTVEAIEELDFDIDLSISPYYDYSPLGGPDFSRFSSNPGWFGRSRQLLSLPTTAAMVGKFEPYGSAVSHLVRRRLGNRSRTAQIAKRVGLWKPARLSPEGSKLSDMKRITERLHGGGLRVFTLSLHSPSFRVGGTPYVKSDGDVQSLIQTVDDFLAFFSGEFGGKFTAPSELRERLLALHDSAHG
ncbi:glycosyltransferase [Roseomonas sp. WA12]